ncbi:MAG: TetR/AcrR family transcriptional regulator [Cyanobacteria bacterium P01_E01_bin.42]
MARPKTSRSPARDRIVATASELFYREGIRNVGIDRIIAESNVAKMSLYKHFKSKDALIATCLQQRAETWRTRFQETVESRATEPRERILAVFDVYEEWFEQPDFRGCAFINSFVELADLEHPAYQVNADHWQAMSDYLLTLARDAHLADPETLVLQLTILLNGATITAMTQGNARAAVQAKTMAISLIDATAIEGDRVPFEILV